VKKPWRFPPEPFEVWLRAGGQKAATRPFFNNMAATRPFFINCDHATAIAATL
jgi:hypothetical protein